MHLNPPRSFSVQPPVGPEGSTYAHHVHCSSLPCSLSFVSCDQDGGFVSNPNQERILLLLDELYLADQEVMQYKAANAGAFPEGSAGTKTYTSYTNANGTLIDGTDNLSAPPPPQYGQMDMDFSGGEAGSLTRLRLNMTIPASGPKTVTFCHLDATDVMANAQALFEH